MVYMFRDLFYTILRVDVITQIFMGMHSLFLGLRALKDVPLRWVQYFVIITLGITEEYLDGFLLSIYISYKKAKRPKWSKAISSNILALRSDHTRFFSFHIFLVCGISFQ